MMLLPLQLGDEIGRGAMGAVFEASLDGTPVAVKVLMGDQATEPTYLRAFRTEVRAMATLAHPNVIRVVDFGLAPRGWPAPEGAPFVVMEHAPLTLSSVCGEVEWDEAKRLLDSVLRGLAHAHARGITHRDLKPTNVLLADGVPKLADFGLARAFEAVRRGQHERPAGTPGYMPPEQRQGRWRDIGPWTDLYALGRVALDLVATPDGGSIEVPALYASWVSRLRSEDIQDRYQRAADARRDLWELGEAAVRLDATLSGVGPAADSEAAMTQPYFEDQDSVADALPEPLVPRLPRVPDEPLPEPDVPTPRSAGLLLLRSPRVDRREAACAALWRTLQAVRLGTPHFVALRGPAGGGKRDLAMWMCHQVHETGVGTVELATHDRLGGPRAGLGGMLARELRCLDLDPTAGTDRVLEWLEARDPTSTIRDAGALVTLMAPALAPGVLTERVDVSEDERFERVARFIELDAAGRIPLVWLDALQWADETLRFVAWCMERERPMFFLATLEGTHLDDKLFASGATILEIEPRGEDETRGRLGTCLSLQSGPVLERLARLCGDDLLYARLVLDDWIEDGVVDGTQPTGPLPDTDIRKTWSRRLDSVLAGRGPSAMSLLAAAAALGDEVESARWRVVCRRLSIPADEQLMDALIRRGMAVPVGLDVSDWRFASPEIRRLLDERAGSEQMARIHRAVAMSYRVEPATRLRRQWHESLAERGDTAS